MLVAKLTAVILWFVGSSICLQVQINNLCSEHKKAEHIGQNAIPERLSSHGE